MDENETTPSRNLSSKERARLAFATLIGAVFGISCMSFSIERNASETAADLQPTIKQRGKLTVNDSQEGIQVYYARPFNSPPNLRLEAGPHNDNIELIVQKADYFTVRLKGTTFARELEWFAQGIPAAIPVPQGVAPIPGVVEITPPSTAMPPKAKDVPPPSGEPIEIPATPPKGP